MEENDEKVLMKPTREWMKENYERFNKELFNGELGNCQFDIFTTGKGSQGKILGKFKLMNGGSIYVNRYDRSMYIESYPERKYVNGDNFVDLCSPSIMLNGNYSATEESLQSVLVHEMVHYYDYMYGKCPKQAHGPNFRWIASMVSSRSNGRFTVQRVASAEVMSGYKLDAEMQAKRDRRVESKKARALAIFVYRLDGRIEMTLISNTNERVPAEICNYYNRKKGSEIVKEIIASSDPELIEMLYQKGFRRMMRTWKFWNVEKFPWAGDIKKYEYKYLMGPNEIDEGYKMSSVGNVRRIVETVIDEYIKDINRGDIIIGDGDLELESPLERVG